MRSIAPLGRLVGDGSSGQAAGLLSVSRPFLVRLLEEGVIPHWKVGVRRWVLSRDLLAYKQSQEAERRGAARARMEEAEHLGIGYRLR